MKNEVNFHCSLKSLTTNTIHVGNLGLGKTIGKNMIAVSNVYKNYPNPNPIPILDLEDKSETEKRTIVAIAKDNGVYCYDSLFLHKLALFKTSNDKKIFLPAIKSKCTIKIPFDNPLEIKFSPSGSYIFIKGLKEVAIFMISMIGKDFLLLSVKKYEGNIKEFKFGYLSDLIFGMIWNSEFFFYDSKEQKQVFPQKKYELSKLNEKLCPKNIVAFAFLENRPNMSHKKESKPKDYYSKYDERIAFLGEDLTIFIVNFSQKVRLQKIELGYCIERKNRNSTVETSNFSHFDKTTIKFNYISPEKKIDNTFFVKYKEIGFNSAVEITKYDRKKYGFNRSTLSMFFSDWKILMIGNIDAPELTLLKNGCIFQSIPIETSNNIKVLAFDLSFKYSSFDNLFKNLESIDTPLVYVLDEKGELHFLHLIKSSTNDLSEKNLDIYPEMNYKSQRIQKEYKFLNDALYQVQERTMESFFQEIEKEQNENMEMVNDEQWKKIPEILNDKKSKNYSQTNKKQGKRKNLIHEKKIDDYFQKVRKIEAELFKRFG